MRHYRFLSLLLAIVLVFACVITYTAQTRVTPVTAQEDGVLDLSTWDFHKNGTVKLEGRWEFYFNQFITPEAFERGIDSKPVYVDVPSARSAMNEVKPFPETQFYGTMRMRVKLPAGNEIYGIKSHIILSAYKLYLNGTFMDEVGKVGTGRDGSEPYYKVLYSYYNPIGNELDIIYHTSDFYFDDCAIMAPELGYADQISQLSRMNIAEELFLFGMLLTMGFYHLGLYYSRKKDMATLYFGIFCLMFGLRMLIVGEKVLPSTLHINYLIYARLAYITVYAGFTALCAFLYTSFLDLFKKRFMYTALLISSIAAFVTLVAPFRVVDKFLVLYAAMGFAMLGYAMIKLILGIKRKIRFSGIVLFGFIVIILSFLNDFIYELTLTNHASLIPVGIAVFILTQAYTLSNKFSYAYMEIENLSLENEKILDELKNVNSNLESIVESRTKELRDALEEMDLMSKTDYLTKLPNRRLMFQKIKELQRDKTPFYVCIADIDKFKIVNDTYGHDKGDVILKDLSDRLVAAIGDSGFVGRWGGEEFMMILYGENDGEVLDRAEEIREVIASKYNIVIHSAITITIGICKYIPEFSLDVAIANSDKALYEGKINGRNQCRLFHL